MLASLYYMSNYSTKDDVKLHQLVMTASIFKSALEKATAAKENLTPQQLRLLKTKPGGNSLCVTTFEEEKVCLLPETSPHLIIQLHTHYDF